MQFDTRFLYMPPYITTSWDQIASLHAEPIPESSEFKLIIRLKDQSQQAIFPLPKIMVEQISTAFYQHLKNSAPMQRMPDSTIVLTPEKVLHHNEELSHLPDLPPELVKRVLSAIELTENFSLQESRDVPLCNCIHCQVVRQMKSKKNDETGTPADNEPIKLRFWDVREINNSTFEVTRPKDDTYTVTLSPSVRCSCNKIGCEHIAAALRH